MKNILQQAVNSKNLVRLYRDKEENSFIDGYVYAFNDKLALLITINDAIYLDSFTVLSLQDITSVKLSPRHNFYKKVFQLRDVQLKDAPSLDLSNMATAINSVIKVASVPFLVIHIRDDDDVCWIGQAIKCDETELELTKVDVDGIYYEHPTTYSVENITYVNFDGPYEEALWIVNQARSKEVNDGSIKTGD